MKPKITPVNSVINQTKSVSIVKSYSHTLAKNVTLPSFIKNNLKQEFVSVKPDTKKSTIYALSVVSQDVTNVKMIWTFAPNAMLQNILFPNLNKTHAIVSKGDSTLKTKPIV